MRAVLHSFRSTAIALAAIAVSFALTTPAQAAFAGGSGSIVFTAKKRLWLTNPGSGTPWYRLMADETNQAQAAWSPDGSRVAFRAGPDGDTEIWVVNHDGTGLRQVTDTPNPSPTDKRFASQPSWTPDGQQIAFRTDRTDPTNADLWIVGADGSNLRPLVQTPGNERYPAFSPDGTKLAYRSDLDGDPEIYLARADGSNPVQLTNNALYDSAPAWSPDGTRIAFERGPADAGTNSSPGYAAMELWTMAAAGGDEQRLTSNAVHDEGPAWAPDGSGAILFTREQTAGNPDLWVREAGGAERQLTDLPSTEESPDWQPLRAGMAPALGTGIAVLPSSLITAKPKAKTPTTTAATPGAAGTQGAGGAQGKVGPGSFVVATRRVRVSRTGTFVLRIRSSAGYRGELSLRRGTKVLHRRASVKLAAGKTTTIRVRLGRAALRRLRAAKRMTVELRPSKIRITLLAPR
jgi:Tol biopolymer transport system component